jgi:hypothetical protein
MAQNPTSNDFINLGFKISAENIYSRIPLMDESKLPKVYIGLDMGETTRMAVWFPVQKKLMCYSLTFIQYLEHFYNIILSQTIKYNVIMVIEDVAANSPVFLAEKVYNETKGRYGYPATHENKLAAVCKLAERVGSVKEKTKTAILLCERHKITVIKKRPTKASKTKLTHEEFVKLTGYKHRTDPHQRDAGMMVIGMR